jgi:long-chain fatty acid transport protein
MNARTLSPKWTGPVLAALSAAAMAGGARAQYGTILSSAGPVNTSMAGASTAAPLSACGALIWNPATMPGLGHSELEASVGGLFPSSQLTSRISAGAIRPGIPPIGLAGQTDSDTGVYPLPAIGLVYLPEGSAWSFGLSAFVLAGFGVDYPGSGTNFPVTPPPPLGIGFGPVFSEFQVLQIQPAATYQLTERLSVGGGPAVNLAILKADPALFSPMNDANRNGVGTYPSATHSETTWGAGFTVGAYYKADTWAAGASVKSPQWFDKFRYNSADELGRPLHVTLNADLPLIASVGVAYTGMERLVLALDGRYLDYANANFIGDSGISLDGTVRGLGWRSIFAVAAGAQYQLSDALSVRLGYTWNQNPIPNSQAFVNIASPTIVEHTLYAGASWNVTEDFTISLSYSHGFQNSIEGPGLTQFGPVPGSAVKTSASGDAVIIGASVRFGGPRPCAACPPNCQPDEVRECPAPQSPGS